MNVVWVSETGLIATRSEEGFYLEDPLEDDVIQLCDSLHELKRIVEDIELNPFKVGDKVRVKRYEDEYYKEGQFDTIYSIRSNGAMRIEFHEDGISDYSYTWDDLRPYTEDVNFIKRL